MIAPKGSMTLDGVSLTVNEVREAEDSTHFAVNIIPHTAQHTTLGELKPADSSMSRSTCSPAISTGCWPSAHTRNRSVPTFHHITM